jgi:Flp pilus assembly protein TadB
MMNTKVVKLKIKLIFFAVFAMLIFFQAEAFSQPKSVRKAEKKKEQLKKDYQKARKKEINRRFEIQSDGTKKQMKETHKRAKTHNRSAKDETSFTSKLFSKKKKNKK